MCCYTIFSAGLAILIILLAYDFSQWKSPDRISSDNQDNLRLLLDIAEREITRYRDREWKNMTLFTTAMGAIIYLIIASKGNSIFRGREEVKCAVNPALLGLTLGNIFYTCFAHRRLTVQRNRRNEIQWRLHIIENNIQESWWNGFWDHLIPFFLADIMLLIFGCYLLDLPPN